MLRPAALPELKWKFLKLEPVANIYIALLKENGSLYVFSEEIDD